MPRRALLLLALIAAAPTPAHAQLSLVEGLFRNVTDLSFYFGRGGILPASDRLRSGDTGIFNFGVELLFEVGSSGRTVRLEGGDSVRLQWTGREIRRDGESVDTVDTYAVAPSARTRTEKVWSYEMGVGYGQISGFELTTEALDLRGSIRELPAVNFYAVHEPSGLYAGVRSGLIQTHALQLWDAEGKVYGGVAQSFQIGGAVGYAATAGITYPFVELGWMYRKLPSIEWRSSPLPEDVPRELGLSGWQAMFGLQIPLR